MKLLHRRILLISALSCFSIIYLVTWTMKTFNNIHSSMITAQAHRMNFLLNTFCGRFISGSWEKAIHKTMIKQRQRFLEDHIKHSFTHYNNLSCSQFNNKSGFYSKKITNLEHENPMAFAILVYKHPYQFRVLMRTLYVRTNFHCIHVDRSAPAQLHAYALKLSTCLENVYLVDPRIEVKWGDISILEAERLCQRLLLNRSSAWHYYMLISGTELPIQTNLNRLQILQLAPDKSRVDVASYPQPDNRQRSKKTPPPGNITIYKGQYHCILTRNFIEALHTHPIAFQLYNYLNRTFIPDEHYYPSLVRLPDFPGSGARIMPTYTSDKLLSHYKIWHSTGRVMCRSKKYHGDVCQFNYEDLQNIEKSGRLFVNKFNEENDLVGIDCWEQWLKVKEKYHQDIDPQRYIDQYPFLQRTAH